MQKDIINARKKCDVEQLSKETEIPVGKKIVKKSKPKKVVTKKVPRKAVKNKKVESKNAGAKSIKVKNEDALLELIRITSTVVPDDVTKVILAALEKEQKNTTAAYAMEIIQKNIDLAKKKSQPLCQDTGTVLFFVAHPKNFDQIAFTKKIEKAVVEATKKGYLRQNSVSSLTGENSGLNIGPGHPSIHFHQHAKNEVEIRLMLKGGGCENVSAQYSLPDVSLEAGRDLQGVRRVILDAIVKAQGKGCGPGVLGVCIGGDRAHSHAHAKEQLLRKLDDQSPIPELAALEKEIVEVANQLGIGPMGFGGKTTLIGCKIDHLNRLPASFFVSVSYMCWAFRRQGVVLDQKLNIKKWLY